MKIMKWCILLFLCFYTSLVFSQQEFLVTATKGVLKKGGSDQLIKPGDRLKPTDQVIFASPNAAAELVSSSTGRYVLKQKRAAPNGGFSPIKALMTDYLQLSKGHMSTRGGSLCNPIDFINYFTKDTLLVIGDTCTITLCNTFFIMTDTSYFIVLYNYQGDTIYKKLEYNNNKLKFIRSSLYRVDGKLIDPSKVGDHELYFYHQNRDQGEKICDLKLCFVSSDELIHTIKMYLVSTKNEKLKPDEKMADIKSLIHDLYGTPDNQLLTEWLKKNIIL
jgi:hypothetical protein